MRYFYSTFHKGDNGKQINWIRDLWNAFYFDSPPNDIDKCLDKLAQEQFLLIDSLPFAMKYSSKIRGTTTYNNLVNSCSDYFLSKFNRIKLLDDAKVALAFKLNGEKVIEVFSNKITLPSGQKLNSEMIAATRSGFPTCPSLKEKWSIK